MPKVYRKSEAKARNVEVFSIELIDGDADAMRTNPENFIRKALEGDISHVNGVSIDINVMNDLNNGVPIAGYIVHHTVSGEWESWVEITRPK